MQDSQAGHLRGAPVRAPGIQRRASKFPEAREIVRLRGLTPETVGLSIGMRRPVIAATKKEAGPCGPAS